MRPWREFYHFRLSSNDRHLQQWYSLILFVSMCRHLINRVSSAGDYSFFTNIVPSGGLQSILKSLGISNAAVTLFAGTGDGGGIPSIR